MLPGQTRSLARRATGSGRLSKAWFVRDAAEITEKNAWHEKINKEPVPKTSDNISNFSQYMLEKGHESTQADIWRSSTVCRTTRDNSDAARLIGTRKHTKSIGSESQKQIVILMYGSASS
mmetsp:Transcript_11307/g.31773  ORF Transcript_11307/g.31773 Transcript_11307/m.31773 type:complete len:120 (+) Transcript_11307:902-1261(+)